MAPLYDKKELDKILMTIDPSVNRSSTKRPADDELDPNPDDAKKKSRSDEKREKKKTKASKRSDFRNRQKLLLGMINQTKKADLVFLVDCTGSMGPYIKETKAQISKIVDACIVKLKNQVRVAFVGYRDFADRQNRIVSIDLTEDVPAVVAFMENVEAKGGGDECEDVFGGLQNVLALDWKFPTRILIHVGDAPQHGSRFNGGCKDSYAKFNAKDPRGLKIEDLIDGLKRLGVNYFFGQINKTTNAMIAEFRKVAKDDNFVREVDMRKPSNIFEFSLTSIEVSTDGRTKDTLSAMRGTLTFPKSALTEFEKQTETENSEILRVKWYECIFPSKDCKLDDVKTSMMKITHRMKKEIIQRAENHFAQGSQRFSYHGLMGTKKRQIVLKKFKAIYNNSGCLTDEDIRKDYNKLTVIQAVAAHMAREFNKISPTDETKKISFIDVGLVEVQGDGDAKKVFYTVEDLLFDYKLKFTKWCNNTGYVNQEQFAPSIEAFCHWTYDVTKGFLMIVDIQGVARGDEYILTDPCIHCVDDVFGDSNFGEVGMHSFFKTHVCNKICKSLKLSFPPPELEKDSDDSSAKSDTSGEETENEDRGSFTDGGGSDSEVEFIVTSPEISDIEESPAPSSDDDKASEASIESAVSSDY